MTHDDATDCSRRRAARDPARILVAAEGTGMALRLSLYPTPAPAGEPYSALKIDPQSVYVPQAGSVWECVVSRVVAPLHDAMPDDLAKTVWVKFVRYARDAT